MWTPAPLPSITATTTSLDSRVLGDRRFDLAVIDEACQSTEPGCWIPLLRCDRVVLAGDHCQLPPTVVSREAAAEGVEVRPVLVGPVSFLLLAKEEVGAGDSVAYAGGEAELFRALTALAGGGQLTDEQRAALGADEAAARQLVDRLRSASDGVLVVGGFALARREAAEAARAFARAVGVKELLVGPMANSHGLELLGVLPSHERYAFPGMLQEAKALIVSHLDPAKDPDVAASLKERELLVVHDMFLTETARLADVVLPARSVYEKDGTVVNLEGRFLPVRAAPVEAGQAEDFTGVVRYLGEALGERLEGRSVRSARRVLKRRLELDLAELPDNGVIPRLKARPAPKVTTREAPAAGGNVLIAPSMARVEYLHRNPHLNAAVGGPKLSVNPADAEGLGVMDGAEVRLRVGGVWRDAVVRVTEAVPAGLMTLPALPEQGVGLVQADLGSLVVDQVRLEVAS